MTAAYRVVCSRDAWCRSDNDRHRLSTEATKNGMLLHSEPSKLNALALTGVQACPGGRVYVYCITTLGYTNSIAVELCFDAFRIPSCPGGFTIQISSRLIISRLKLIYQLFFLVKPAIDISYTACDYPLCNLRIIQDLHKTVILLRHCEVFQIELLNPRNL